MGNIIKDSFKVDYVDYTKIPNRIEVTFADKDDGWKNNTLEVVDEAEWALGKAKRTKAISLIGVTDKAQALREAKFFLNRGRNVRKGIEFATTIAACHSEPGDIIAFQHDVPQWGWGGRVLGGTSTTCIVDQDIPQSIIDAPTTYDIKIIHSDDTIETYDIVSVDGKTVTIGGGDTFSPVPTEDESYILGKEGSTIAEYRIQEVSLTPEEEVQIKATEHNASIYSDTGLVISTDESTELPDPSAFAPQVSNLVLYEHQNINAIGISFRQPEDTLVFSRADVYISVDNRHFTKIAEGYGDDDIEYYNVSPGLTYYVKVYSINKIGIKNTNPAEANITFYGIALGTPSSPTGLEVIGQGNDTTFTGRDCKIVWRLNAPFGGAGSLAPEVPAGISPEIRVTLVKDFIVQVWDGTETTLLREEITTDKWYIYTWEKNFEDNNGIPVGDFVFRVYQRNYFNKISKQPARLAVTTDKPSAPTGLSTTPEEDGVTFSWNDSALSDFNYYEYRTKVDSGSWSSFIPSYDNEMTRWLNGNEIANQANAKSSVYAEIRTIDVFNATSVVTSGNASCSNFKGYFTVSPDEGKGHFTTIASAVNALSDAGGTIILKEGNHQLPTSAVLLPDTDLSIVGAGTDRTRLVSPAGIAGQQFKIWGKSSTYRFNDFTASYLSHTQPAHYISCSATQGDAGALETNTADLYVSNIKMYQGAHPQTANEGIYYRGVGKLSVENSDFNDGEKAIVAYGNNVHVENNNFSRQRTWSVYIWSTTASNNSTVQIVGNRFDPLMRYGLFMVGDGITKGAVINNNTIIMNTATGALVDITGSSQQSTIYGLWLKNLEKSVVHNNNFIYVNASDMPQSGGVTVLYGLALSKSKNVSVMGNTCHASINAAALCTFIHCNASVFSTTIAGNTAEMINATVTNTFYGIYAAAAQRNVISDNVIKMGSRSNDYGIILQSTAKYNYGRGNLVWNAANDIVDSGASNDVIATLT
jgi:hypothetical protein